MHLDVNLWPQNTTWQTLREHALLADRLAFDTLWVWDHFYSISGDLHRPNLEGWQLQAAYAAITENVRIGCLVTASPIDTPRARKHGHDARQHLGRTRDPRYRRGVERPRAQRVRDRSRTPAERSNRFAEATKIIRQLVRKARHLSGKYYELVTPRSLSGRYKRGCDLIGGGENSAPSAPLRDTPICGTPSKAPT